MQNRLYPQGNDGATNLYEKFRGFVVDEFSELLGVERKWKVECGSMACRDHVRSHGTHYKDYHHNNSCSIFYPEAKKTEMLSRIMDVGHNAICPHCGNEHTNSGMISHISCAIKAKEEEDWDWIL